MTLPKFSRLDPGQRREQILDAANALLAQRPYDEVSIDDIANAAGVTRGLVHHYFGGRKEVYIALLERLGARCEYGLRPPMGSTPARAWPTPCRAGLTAPRPTARSGSPRSRMARTSPTPTSPTSGPRRRAARDLSPRHRRGLPAPALRARVLDRPPPRRDTTLAPRGGDPRRDTGAARLNARTRPAHVRGER